MKPGLALGATGELSQRVTPDAAIALGPPPGFSVFSTPSMIRVMEQAARQAVEGYLEDGEVTVGTEIGVRHLAGTPLGQTVRAVARLTAMEGRALTFEIEAYNETTKIGEGTHKRVVVLLSRLKENLESAGAPKPSAREEFDPMKYETIGYRSEGGIGWLTLRRENSLNAVNIRMVEEIEDLQARLGEDTQTRVLVITGAGRAFCAGDDIKELATLNEHEAELLSLRQARMYHRFRELPQVVIAAVNGPALGAGCICAAFADIRIASFAATFGMPEIKLGWSPGYGNAQIMQLIGRGRTMEIVLTGETISAQEAHAIGLVENLVPANNLVSAAQSIARKLLSLPPVALRETKGLIHQDAALGPNESYVNDTASYVRCFKTNDAKEGIRAFIEKRAPKWSGT